MRSFTTCSTWFLALLAALATENAAALGENSPAVTVDVREPTYDHVNGLVERSGVEHKPYPIATATMVHKRQLTNAERLGRGLHLKPPVRRSRGRVARAQTSPLPPTDTTPLVDDTPTTDDTSDTPLTSDTPDTSPTDDTPDTPSTDDTPDTTTPVDTTPAPPVTYTGTIQARRLSDESVLGYMSLSNGALKLSTTTSGALEVTVTLDAGATSGTGLSITMPTSTDYPLLGMIQAGSGTAVDLGVGSSHYLYLSPLALPGSVANSVPVILQSASSSALLAETAIWNLDLTTGSLVLQWVNPDGSTPKTEVLSQSGYILAAGDVAEYAHYPAFSSPITTMTLHFVPTVLLRRQ